MHAVACQGTGGPEVLRWEEVPDPEPGPGEVLLDVTATSVNRADLLQREGRYPPPPGASPYLGLECSGVVAALGPGAQGPPVGSEVCALLSGGGYAERVAVPVGQLMAVPAGLSLVTAGAVPEAACTVWSNLFLAGRLQPGDTLLVHGGSGGIGTMAIQVGVAYGARVLCTAGSSDKLARCRELGADTAISYRDEDFVARVREVTGGRGADVVLDNMGAAYLARNVDVLARNGRLVVIGLQGGRVGELDLGRLLSKNGSVLATSLRGRPLAEKASIVEGTAALIWPWLADGSVQPVVDRVLPLREAAEAHRIVESGAHVGKVVLTTS